MKKILLSCLLMVWTISMFGQTYSGTCGNNATWTLNVATGELVIAGHGDMNDYAAGAQPWYVYRDKIKTCKVSLAITKIGENAFDGCDVLYKMSYPATLDGKFVGVECKTSIPTPPTPPGTDPDNPNPGQPDPNDPLPVTPEKPVISTLASSNIGETTATIGGNVVDDGGALVIDRGVCWGLSSTSLTNCESEGVDIGDFHISLSNLEANTTYYYQAYATNNQGTSRGEVLSFKTKEITDPCEQHPYVILWTGGPKWATKNVGACDEKDLGQYYCWGETSASGMEGNTQFGHYCSWSYYKYKGSNSNTNPYTKYGVANDGNLTLLPEDDAARAQWGGTWRIPTQQEWKDLINECNWVWTYNQASQTGGYTITSKEFPDRKIYLPLCGYKKDGQNWNFKEENNGGMYKSFYGRYWSSTAIKNPSTKDRDVYILYWYTKYGAPSTVESGPSVTTQSIRYWGQSVRPVCD